MSRRLCFVIALIGTGLAACCCGGPQAQNPPNVPANNNPPIVVEEKKPIELTPNDAGVIGHFRVSLMRGTRGDVNMRDDLRQQPIRSVTPLTMIRVKIENTSVNLMGHYEPWTGKQIAPTAARMSDNLLTPYRAIHAQFGQSILGQLKNTTRIDPGKSIEDAVIFDAFPDAATELRLELPGQNLGKGTERLVYKISTNWIAAR